MHAKSTRGIRFEDNIIEWSDSSKDRRNKAKVGLIACSEAAVEDNRVEVEIK